MIAGIIAAVLFIIVCLRVIDKRVWKKKGMLSKIHVFASNCMVLAVILHIILTFPILVSRPFLVTVTGIATTILLLTACFSAIKRQMKLHRLSAICAAVLLALHIAFNLAGVFSYQSRMQNTTIANVDLSEIPDGIYVGEYDVTFIYAKVEVTVRDNKITNIAILEHRNERGSAAEAITDSIIQQQKIEVDAISSATNSSTVIQKAVENALFAAKQ